MRQILAFIFAPLLIFCAAVPPETVPPDYLITQITVTCPDRSPTPLMLTDQQQMGAILEYLRTLSLHSQADTDSIDTSLPLYTLRLTHATGRITEYRQLGEEYLSKNDSPWYHIDPAQGCFLVAFFPSALYNNKNTSFKEAAYEPVTKHRHLRPC